MSLEIEATPKIKPPTIVYFAFKFSGDPTKNTRKARAMAIKLMKIHPDWFVICPHFAIDAFLDGTTDWGRSPQNFTEWRRTRAGMMSVAFLSRSDIMVLGCAPRYTNSSGVTWEHVIAQVLNRSFRKENPVRIVSYKEALKP